MEENIMGRPAKPTGRQPFIPNDLVIITDYEEPPKPIHLTPDNLKEMSIEEISMHIEAILKRYAEGEYLKLILPDYGINRWRWRIILAKNPQLHARFNEARESHIEALLERMYEIADDGSQDILTNNNTGAKYLNKEFVARSKLRVELIQWSIEKLEKRKYYPALRNASSIAKKASLLTDAMFEGHVHSTQCAEALGALTQEATILKTHELEKRLELLEKNMPTK